ncbi:MAG: hypothetical protein KHX55_01560 [Proteobacteria bacterium]|nr:hypothetical protein [Pseudomonadota bacterium]
MLKPVFLSLLLALCAAMYFLGRSDCQQDYIEQQAGVQEHVRQQTAAIHAKPNAKRDALLELMRRGKL